MLWTPSSVESIDVSAAVAGHELTVTPGMNFVGEFTVNLAATDGIDVTQSSFVVAVTNASPISPAITDQWVSHRTAALQFELPSVDMDGDSITYTVELGQGPTASMASELESRYQFFATETTVSNNFYENFRGQGEKYFE